MIIQIDNVPFAKDEFYSGVYTEDIGDELEYRQLICDFTLVYSIDETDDRVINITWLDFVPSDEVKAEEDIISQFYKNKEDNDNV